MTTLAKTECMAALLSIRRGDLSPATRMTRDHETHSWRRPRVGSRQEVRAKG